jgi:spore germination protein GerM
MSPTTPSIPPPRPLPPSGRSLWLVLGIAIAGVLLGVWLVMSMLPKWLRSGTGTGQAGAQTGAAAESRKIHATLFYVSDDGAELVPASREVPFGATPAEQARRVAEAQVQPAPPGFTSPVPPGTTVRGLYLTARGEAFVDLSHEIVAAHSGGSLDETLTVFAIVNALTVNLPDVSAVQILIDGKETDTLAGHVDLRHPLGRSMKWIKRQ